MKLFNKITNSEKYKGFIHLFLIFFFINNLIAFGSENKSVSLKGKNNGNEFEKTFFQNSVPYSSYDNSENQLEIFFGRWRDLKSENIFYPDLSIINDSDSLRQLYKSKLNDMVINENYNNK